MKITVPCFLRICSNKTEPECIEKSVFGGVKYDYASLQSVDKGHLGFLYNAERNSLLGVFAAEGKASYNLVPGAFNDAYPLHIKVRPVTHNIIRIDNVYDHLDQIIKLKKARAGCFSYPQYPVHGPDITEKILKLFYGTLDGMPPELKEFLAIDAGPAALPGHIIDNGFDLEQVAGLEQVKNFIRSRIIAPARDPERADKFKLRVGGGMLLYGPPGTGKTLIARAISGEIQAKFFEITPSFIIGYPGEAEENLEKLFSEIARQPRAVLFMDEAEWILKTRDGQSSSVMERITPVLLSQLSTLFNEKDRHIIIIAATNEPQKIDKAFLRPGRFDKKFYVGLPNAEERLKILKINLKDKACQISEDEIIDIAAALDGYSGADIAHIIDEAAFDAFDRNDIERDHILKDDIMKAMTRTEKSVTEDIIEKFKKFENCH